MNKTLKKTLSIILSILMIVSAIPIAFAADGDACVETGCIGTYTNGFCSADATHYEQPTQNSDEAYEIGNAGQLYWLADKVNGGDRWINAVLTDDINVNPGYTFTFVEDTGLVEIKKDTTVVAYVGTGLSGDASGNNTVFDTTASVAGAVYATADDATEDAVDLSAVRVWTPIGIDYDYSFNGAFDGNGKTVSGLYFNDPSSVTYVGLIGYSGADVTVKDVTMSNSCFIGYWYIAGIVGINNGTVTGCVNEVFISATAAYAGGITGGNNGKVARCMNRGTIVSVYGGGGGIVGHNGGGGTVEFCGNEGNVFDEMDGAGGIAGSNNNGGIIRNCWNIGKIYADGNLVDDIVSVNDGTVTNCYYLGASESDSIDGTTFKTTAQFASGEVAYLLNGNQSSIVFRQICGEGLPAFSGKQVYHGYLSCANDAQMVYTNNADASAEKPGHSGGEATCKVKAVCETCGQEYGNVDEDNHDIINDEAVAPTCTETGLTAGSHCSRCDNATVAQEIVPATNHKDTIVQVEAKAKTCTEIGWDAYEYCTKCNYSTYKKIDASHNIETVEAKAPACTDIGWNAYEYCKDCDYSTYKEIPANGHTKETVKGYDATCTETGLTDGVKCSVCGGTLTAQEVISVKGHADANGDGKCDIGGEPIETQEPDTPDTPDEPSDEPTDDTTNDCDHLCHSDSAFVQFIWKIVRFFQKLFGIQQYCDCGITHW